MEIRITRRLCPRTWDVLLSTGQCVTTAPLFTDLQAEYLQALKSEPPILCLADGMTFDAREIVALVPGQPILEDEIPGSAA
ncbi:MAG TPA: hypothetical protein VKZ58_05475 [Longimicrobiales bacterium]|nr:hypothetical protein [Longimicrobiales bacterium]